MFRHFTTIHVRYVCMTDKSSQKLFKLSFWALRWADLFMPQLVCWTTCKKTFHLKSCIWAAQWMKRSSFTVKLITNNQCEKAAKRPFVFGSCFKMLRKHHSQHFISAQIISSSLNFLPRVTAERIGLLREQSSRCDRELQLFTNPKTLWLIYKQALLG